jgi:hypothetical protein
MKNVKNRRENGTFRGCRESGKRNATARQAKDRPQQQHELCVNCDTKYSLITNYKNSLIIWKPFSWKISVSSSVRQREMESLSFPCTGYEIK